MCGIVGIVGVRAAERVSVGEKMLSKIAHRGPDGQNFKVTDDQFAFIGHARLSIIDLAGGEQPMWSQTKDSLITYNGELYNYKALRIELEKLGFHFNSNSDTEVILNAYEAWGRDCLSRFNGIFSFCIYSPKLKKAFLARDHFGVKPLYYRVQKNSSGSALYFSSELRSLATSLKKLELSSEGVSEYLSLGYTIAPATLLSGVFQLLHGHFAEFDGEKLVVNRYYDLAKKIPVTQAKKTKNPGDVSEEFRYHFSNAVERQLVSDVPVGTFLSGGLDSNLLTAVACGASNNPITAFTGDFHESEYSESNLAKSTSEYLGIQHQIFHLKKDTIPESWLRYGWYSDAPIFDNSFVPVFELCRETAKHTKVVLSGDGGDEVFLGYETYRADAINSKFSKFSPVLGPILNMAANALPVRHGKVPLNFKIKAFSRYFGKSPSVAHCGWREIAPRRYVEHGLVDEFAEYFRTNHVEAKFSNIASRVDGSELLTQMSFLDFETWLANDILVKTDRAGMANGLEVRVPFLDLDLVEFGLALSDSEKFSLRKTKRPIRNSMHSYLPNYPIDHPKKGFNAPMSEWLAGPLRESLMDLVRDRGIFKDLFRQDAIENWVQDHLKRKLDLGYFLWAMVVLDQWFSRIIDDGLESSKEFRGREESFRS